MIRRTARLVAFALVLVASALASPAFAQAPPPPTPAPPALPAETVRAQAVTTGRTDLAPGGLSRVATAKDEEEQYMTELALSAGGLFAAGNAKTVALTSGARFRMRRYEHQITAAAAANFARAAQAGADTATTVENYQGMQRYDYFVGRRVSLFGQTIGRRDRFQGLDLRANLDPGVAYHFIQTVSQRLVAEAGYDLQHDIRRDATRLATTPVSAKTQTLHNARALLGYENRLYPQASFIATLEHIQNWSDLDVYRMVFDVGIKSTLRDSLAVAMTYTMRYENRPLPDVQKTDSLASISLVYTLF